MDLFLKINADVFINPLQIISIETLVRKDLTGATIKTSDGKYHHIYNKTPEEVVYLIKECRENAKYDNVTR